MMTGAVLPSGLRCRRARRADLERPTATQSSVRSVSVEAWQNVHRRGSDTRQGALLLAAGTRLGAPEVAIAASAGMARVRVSSQPAIVVISTGNELVEPGEPILPHQIRRSNAYAIAGALRRHGFQRVADDHVRDDDRSTQRAAEVAPRHARRVDPIGRRLDGQVRSRAARARGARRAA